MILKDVIALKRMSRGQFLHYAKDILLVAIDRTGGTDELRVLFELVAEELDIAQTQTLALTLEMVLRNPDGRAILNQMRRNWLTNS